MNQEHISIDSLGAYLDAPNADEFTDLRLHLISCRECRDQARLISQLRAENSPVFSQAGTSEEDELRIADYVDGQGTAKQGEEIARRLETDKQALKSALHYATQSAAMQRELGVTPESAQRQVKPQHPSGGLLSHISQYFHWRTPLWISTPVTAALTLLLVVLVYPFQPSLSPTGFSVASYQDNAVLSFRSLSEPQPGIGFFSSATSHSRPFAPMTISLNQQQLQMQWPAVENAEGYQLKLFIIKGGQRNKLSETSGATASATIEGFMAEAGSRYEWTLSGQTRDGFLFSTDGGFVFDAQN